MATISLRLTDEENKVLQEFVSVNNIKVSQFVRDAIFEKINEELGIDDERIFDAYKRSFKEKTFDHTEVWEKLGV